jgi:hypothetical protein
MIYMRIHIPSGQKLAGFRALNPASLVRVRNDAIKIVAWHLQAKWKIRRFLDFLWREKRQRSKFRKKRARVEERE